MFSLIFDEMPTDNYFYIGGLETLVSEDNENYQVPEHSHSCFRVRLEVKEESDRQKCRDHILK